MSKKALNVMEQAKATKQIGSMVIKGKGIVAVAIRAESTVRDALIACKGLSPEQLESVKAGVRQAWQEHREAIGVGKDVKIDERTIQMMQQAVYNRQSEQIAVLTAFQRYAGMDVDTAAEFDNAMLDCQSYHKMVEYCRHVVRATAGQPITIAEINKKAKARGELKANQLKAVTKNLKQASAEQLVVLREVIAKRLAMLKPKAAEVVKISDRQKARKVQVKRAASAVKAVNRKAA